MSKIKEKMIMAIANNSNAIELMQKGIEAEIHKKIESDIVNKYMDMVEKEIRETIRPLIESATIKSIEQFRDAMQQADEVRVLLHWDDTNDV